MEKIGSMKIFLSILISWTLNMSSYGQCVGLKLNAGLSMIPETIELSTGTSHSKIGFSGTAGVFLKFETSKKSFLQSEILFIKVAGNETNNVNIVDVNGNKIQELKTSAKKHLSYVGIPVFYGWQKNKTALTVGFQIACALKSKGSIESQRTDNGITMRYTYNQSELDIKKFDYGPRLGLIYHVSDKVSFEGLYYYGLPNILDNNTKDTWRVRQLTIGLQYQLLRTTPK
jgi:opacity protein-like surface antigen